MKYMKQHFCHIIATISMFFLPCTLYGQGLEFKGNDYPIDERTFYNVFGDTPIRFSGKFNINFDMSLARPSRLGYIVRIKSEDDNKIYNLSYYNDGAFSVFKLNEEGKSSIITAKFKTKELVVSRWFQVSIEFDLKKDTLCLTIKQQKFFAHNLKLPAKWAPDIYFGKSDYMIDVPIFSIKQLIISDDKQQYNFPLEESEGEDVHTLEGKVFGRVSNPIWLINESYYWTRKHQFSSSSVAGYNFDDATDNIYIFNKDTLITFNLYSGDVRQDAFANECPIDIFLGTNFLDGEANKLYVYEAHVDEVGKPTIATLDLHTKEWSVVSYENLPMQLHHHSSAYDRANERHFIFGGFGDVYYSKELYLYNYDKKRQDALTLKGKQIEPRYFSSMGYRKDNNSLYIYGGMGNESGEQIVGRQYFYDLHKVDLNNNTISKQWEIPWNKENIVPVREMVIQNDSCFYTLCYPEHYSNTYLKLYRFAFKDGSYQILGDSIPICSEKIKTKANLYYSGKLNKLFAVVQEFDDSDISSSIGIYSLAFPPINSESLSTYKPHDRNEKLSGYILIISLVLLGIVIIFPLLFFLRRRLKKKQSENDKKAVIAPVIIKQTTPLEQNPVKANSIYLFGEFMVRDKQNKDISYMFSTKLKQVFLSILQYSPQGGISSQRLSELFWSGKSEDKVKNSRGVTINHIRGILKEINGVELVHDKGLFKIEYTDEFYCDYLACVRILTENNTGGNETELLEIVTRGKFLRSIVIPEFDSFKGELEQKLEPVLLTEIENSFKKEAYKIVIALCECLFYIDPINDEALYYVIQSLTKMNLANEAKMQYLQFCVEYMNTMNKEYPHSFTDIQKRCAN